MERLFHVFYIGLKKGFGHAERASFLFATFHGYLLFAILLWIGLGLSELFSNSIVTRTPLVFALVSGLSVGALIYINSWYFVKTGRYRRILEKYGSGSQFTKKQKIGYLIIAIVLYISSLVLVIWSGIKLSRHLAI